MEYFVINILISKYLEIVIVSIFKNNIYIHKIDINNYDDDGVMEARSYLKKNAL